MRVRELFEEEDWPEGTVLRVKSDFIANGIIDPQEHMRRMKAGQHGLPFWTFRPGDLLVLEGYSDSGEGYWNVYFDYFDDKRKSKLGFVTSLSSLQRHCKKDDKAWMDSLKEAEDDKERFVIKPFDAMLIHRVYGSDDEWESKYNPPAYVSLDEGEEIIFVRELKSGKVLAMVDRAHPWVWVDKKVFEESTVNRKGYGKYFINSLKEAKIPKAFAEMQVVKPFTAFTWNKKHSVEHAFNEGDTFYFLKELPNDKILIQLLYDTMNARELNMIADKSVLNGCRNISHERDVNFFKGLKENEELKPSFKDWEVCEKAAIDWYQAECDEWNKENGSDYQGHSSLNYEAKCYWNPVTNHFIIPVIDDARESTDDGVYVEASVSKTGIVGVGHIHGVTDGPPKKNAIETMTDDPELLAKIKEREAKSKNRFIEFDPNEI